MHRRRGIRRAARPVRVPTLGVQARRSRGSVFGESSLQITADSTPARHLGKNDSPTRLDRRDDECQRPIVAVEGPFYLWTEIGLSSASTFFMCRTRGGCIGTHPSQSSFPSENDCQHDRLIKTIRKTRRPVCRSLAVSVATVAILTPADRRGSPWGPLRARCWFPAKTFRRTGAIDRIRAMGDRYHSCHPQRAFPTDSANLPRHGSYAARVGTFSRAKRIGRLCDLRHCVSVPASVRSARSPWVDPQTCFYHRFDFTRLSVRIAKPIAAAWAGRPTDLRSRCCKASPRNQVLAPRRVQGGFHTRARPRANIRDFAHTPCRKQNTRPRRAIGETRLTRRHAPVPHRADCPSRDSRIEV